MTRTPYQTPKTTRRSLLQSGNVLLVTRAPQAAPQPAPGQPGAASAYVAAEPDVFIAVFGNGTVSAFNGHVDLGTGIQTALAQIVAEELDVALEQVSMVLGHTGEAPNQGPTIASATIQISAVPLRKAAAQARQFLLARAAEILHIPPEDLTVENGTIRVGSDPAIAIEYGQLLQGQRIELTLSPADIPLKPVSAYRIVGRSTPRVDIPAKAGGALVYVHDMRVPGMLHGRVVRPPYAGRDSGDFIGRSLIAVDTGSIRDVPGIVKVVVLGDFIGVVAEREEQACRAARQLKVEWQPHPPLPDLSDLETALRHIPSTRRHLHQHGDVAAALAQAANVLQRSYVWPYQMHASIGPSCALADYRDDSLTVWSGTQNPHVLRIDLARLLKLNEAQIEVIRMEVAGCYGRNCADDVSADAALLAHAVGRPVRVQLSREQEHAWEPKGAAQLMDVKGAITADGGLAAYDFVTRYPSNDAPTLALLLTGIVPGQPRVLEMGDRSAVPPYQYAHSHIACDDVAPIVRAAWLRGVSALPNVFAHESFIDELAVEAGADPIALRLRHLSDRRAIALIEAVAQRANWHSGAAGSRGHADSAGLLHGRGFAYARYIHSAFPGFGAAWAAWAIDIAVDTRSGNISVKRIVVGQDTGMMVNPDGVRHQIHGNVIQSLSRTLKEQVTFDRNGVTSLEWGAYPILSFTEVPPIEVVLMPRQDEPPLGAGESASVPSAAAIANALFDATGRRFRQPPFTAECVLRTLDA